MECLAVFVIFLYPHKSIKTSVDVLYVLPRD